MSRGDVAIVVRAPCRRAVGDIALFDDGSGNRVLHRLVEMDGGGRFITQGDANAVPDCERLEPGEIEGRVVAILRLGRLVRCFAACRP